MALVRPRLLPSAPAARSPRTQSFAPARLNEAAIRRSCTPQEGSTNSVLVTGAAGFVGFHAALALRREGWGVVGLDNFNAYYSVALKRARTAQLEAAGVHTVSADLNDGQALRRLFALCPVSHVLHLAAQAGVRYAVKNPGAYVHSNVAGFVSLLEAMKGLSPLPPLVYASSSSIYGLNDKVPFSEADRTDRPASLYAATKKSNELLAHTYAHIYGLSATGLRFFTVYGPWGRPDMAAFSFSRAIRAGTPVRIFQGPGGSELSRDFTYVDDIVAGVLGALRTAPPSGKPAPAPRLFNLGNTRPVNVSYFVTLLERRLGARAVRQYVAVPGTGDVLFTSADVSAAAGALGYAPRVELEEGLGRFADWFTQYYGDGEHSGDMEQTFARRRLAEAGEGGEGWAGDGEGPAGEWAPEAGE